MMMENGGGTSYAWKFGDDDDDINGLAGDDADLSIDIESFFSILDERPPGDQTTLEDPFLGFAPSNESASHIGVNENSQTHDDYSEASASRTFNSTHYGLLETNFERPDRTGTFDINDSNGNHKSMDKSEIINGISTSNAHVNSEPFIDVTGYSDIPNNSDDESSIPFTININKPSYSDQILGPNPKIYNNGTLSSDKISSEQHHMHNASSNSTTCFPSSESSTETPTKRCATPTKGYSSHFTPIRDPPGASHKSFGTVDDVESEKSFSIPNWRSFSGIHNSVPRSNISIKNHHVSRKEERESTFVRCSDMGSSSIPSKTSHKKVTYIDVDDPDICILEDMSEPAPKKQPPIDVKSSPISAQRSTFVASSSHMEYNNAKLRPNDERFIYRVALQDLTQPKLEANAPEGSLEVSLLRHQKIALAWMVQKETTSLHCFGGILADDQGLGKTISTIALILKERSPSSSVHTSESKNLETETLNLDDDDEDPITDLNKKLKSPIKNFESKSRPAAGTLVVCPTSVLRQWNAELHNKVTAKSNLSVLVYHGPQRTKDPLELAKYDVVLTTYAIVSMEVPKQPLVDEDEDETKRFLFSTGKKRKYPPSKKGKKGIDSATFESLARPLAKVRWFRVVLDEAQCIKNHRTQTARACWGLRAKRRWCLSGTPIQNAIDDLYSYFRFLRYDPYAGFKSFCSSIKGPIQRNPGAGYKKLQAVLKTIMLRRTKATTLDGEPIISLPPKTINLKKVDFTAEEREFYCRLEADSRAQFEEYAAAGTVKQNYVNILLMLLRLRQACDHPLLVKGCNSGSEWKSSIDKAKKLPPEKRIQLLNCLEASLAICSICNDPPEDAVVTTCEHVFCNQCILEHISSDDNQCPFSKCKVILNTSSVFSKSTLKLSLSDQNLPHQNNSVDPSGSVKPGSCSTSGSVKPEPCSTSGLVKPEPCSTSGANGEWISFANIQAARARESSKIKAAVDVLKGIVKPDADVSVVREKAIVFSQWTRMLDLLEACLEDSGIEYRRLDGTMSVLARDNAVKDFNTRPEVCVMIMSLKAASLGLNMVAACHVMLLDLWWNPTTEDQAIDRAHRIGQTKPVSVLRLTVKDTVEDRILALQQKKREMVSSAFGEDETGSSQTRLTVDDLKYLFQA